MGSVTEVVADNSSYRAPVRLTHDTAKWTLKLPKRSISGVCEVETLLRMPTYVYVERKGGHEMIAN